MDIPIALLIALALTLTFTVIILAFKRPTGDLSVLHDTLERQNLLIQELRSHVEFGDRGQNILREELQRTQRSIEDLRTDYAARKHLEEENRRMVKRLESVIIGSYSKGQAGENILNEIFKLFPREMIAHNFNVNGKVVEFGLVLSDKRVLPIDSKWPATNLVIALDEEKDEKVRLGIIAQIEKEVGRRVKEVCQYINPDVTVPWAVAAVPDSVFSVCKRSYLDSYKRQVILMSYSMTIPYILTFYSLHLQYSRSVDMENLQSHLITIGRQLSEMEQILENKIARGSAMISNAYIEYKQVISRIRASVTYLQATESDGGLEDKVPAENANRNRIEDKGAW
ncbi:MAG TPA: DNA recombination protein RmuC [Anaerolineae bacterium]|jgi:DNA recombination protein RmuC|nr:DNA recombination protein RmuC [Anaerolineae bacterium]